MVIDSFPKCSQHLQRLGAASARESRLDATSRASHICRAKTCAPHYKQKHLHMFEICLDGRFLNEIKGHARCEDTANSVREKQRHAHSVTAARPIRTRRTSRLLHNFGGTCFTFEEATERWSSGYGYRKEGGPNQEMPET